MQPPLFFAQKDRTSCAGFLFHFSHLICDCQPKWHIFDGSKTRLFFSDMLILGRRFSRRRGNALFSPDSRPGARSFARRFFI